MPHRCPWPGTDALYVAYHDEEWGVPVHDDRTWFEFVCLDGQQAGLSWITVLRKRENYRRAFHGFDVDAVARMSDADLESRLLDPGLIRHRQKIFAIRSNAVAFQAVQREFGSFDAYIWQFVGGQPMNGNRESMQQVPATTPESDAMSKDMKKRGFKFCGSTICYAFMQAAGMVNDHLRSCFRHAQVQALRKPSHRPSAKSSPTRSHP